SWHLSVFGSGHALIFSLDSSSDSLELTGEIFGTAPVITSTSVYIPILPVSNDPFPSNFSAFQVTGSAATGFVRWESDFNFGFYLRSGTSQSFTTPHTTLFDNFDQSQSILTVAVVDEHVSVVPEPSALVIGTVAGFGLLIVRRRSDARRLG